MSIEQIRGELDVLSGHVLQNAIDNSNGTIQGIRKYLIDLADMMHDEDDLVMIATIDSALDTLEWQIKDIKPFN